MHDDDSAYRRSRPRLVLVLSALIAAAAAAAPGPTQRARGRGICRGAEQGGRKEGRKMRAAGTKRCL